MSSIVKMSIDYFADPDRGRPIANGNIYVGIIDLDPEIEANQKQISVIQEDGSIIEVSQPLKTSKGGVPVYSGSPVTIVVNGEYSLKVNNKHGVQVYYIPRSSAISDENLVGAADTIQDLRDSNLNLLVKAVQVLGDTTKGDGKGGPLRVWFSGSPIGTYVDNGLTIIVPTGGDGSEAWLYSEITTSIAHIENVALLRLFTGYTEQTIKTLGYLGDNDGGGGDFVWDGSNLSTEVTSDTKSGVYIAPSSDVTGASGAWVRNYSSEVNAKWFGATGIGVADDAASLQAALDYVSSIGGTLFIPRGLYKILTTLTIDRTGDLGPPTSNRKRVNILGEGKGNTVISVDTDSIDGMTYTGDPSGNSAAHAYVTIRDIAFIGSSPTARSANGLKLIDIAYMSVLECTFHNLGIGLALQGCLSSVFDGLIFNESKNGVVGIDGNFSGPHANIFTGCEFRFCTTAAFNGYDSLAQCVFIGCQVEANGTMGESATGGMIFRTDGAAGEVGPSFYGCYFEVNKGGFDVYISETSSRVITLDMIACNMQRVSGTNYVEHNIITEGDIILNLYGCSFTSYNDYVPDISRGYLSLSAATKFIDGGNRFEDLVETPRTPQSIPYAGLVNGSLGAGVTGTLPAGWTVSRASTGIFVIHHNLGNTNYHIGAMAVGGTIITVQRSVIYADTVQVVVVNAAASMTDGDFTFLLQQF